MHIRTMSPIYTVFIGNCAGHMTFTDISWTKEICILTLSILCTLYATIYSTYMQIFTGMDIEDQTAFGSCSWTC